MRGWLIGLALMAAWPALADDLPVAPPSPLANAGAAPATTKVALAVSVTLGKYEARLGETPLNEVYKTIGAGVMEHMGDGGESLEWLCYTLSSDHARLWLSAGESGKLDTITATVSDAAPSSHCPEMPDRFGPTHVDRGIWLGLSEAAMTRMLGPAGNSAGPWRMFHRKLEMPASWVDEDDTLAVRFDKNRLVFLAVSREVTY